MLELPNFGHMTTSTIQFESSDKIWLVTSWTKNYDVMTFFSKYLYFKKACVTIFAGIIKISTIFIKKIFKNSK